MNGILSKNEKGLYLVVDGKMLFPDRSFEKNNTIAKGTIVKDIEVTIDKGKYGFFKGTVVSSNENSDMLKTLKVAMDDSDTVYKHLFNGVPVFITFTKNAVNVYYDGEKLMSLSSEWDIKHYKLLASNGGLCDVSEVAELVELLSDRNEENPKEDELSESVKLNIIFRIYSVFRTTPGFSMEDLKGNTLYVWYNRFVYSEESNIVYDLAYCRKFSVVDITMGRMLRGYVSGEMSCTVDSLIDFCKEHGLAAGPLAGDSYDVNVTVMGREFKFKNIGNTFSAEGYEHLAKKYEKFVHSLPEREYNLVSDANKLVLGYIV